MYTLQTTEYILQLASQLNNLIDHFNFQSVSTKKMGMYNLPEYLHLQIVNRAMAEK